MKKPKIHLICNAHLDPVWQWRWEEGCSEAIATFRNAVQILHENQDFIFNHNEAVLYQWIQKYDPSLFNEIKKLVRKERWFISGGWYLQPDVNLPGIESLIRQILIGKKYFKEQFNVEPNVAYNFDSFGHSGGLPQILRLAGYDMYIHMRPDNNELELPADLYRWKGIDGTEIMAYRPAVGFYHTECEGNESISEKLKAGTEFALKINRDIAIFWGLGNHGGGATREDIQKISEFKKNEKRVEIIHSTTDNFYESIKKENGKLPVFRGDLQRIFTGCYTSLSRIKRQSLKSLSQLVQTESLRTATWWLYNQKYPRLELEESWKDHIFNDFHDILPGSGTEQVEKDVLDQYGKISISLQRERLNAATCFNQNQNAHKSYIPVTILNSNPCLTRFPVEVECMIDHRPRWTGKWHLRLFKLDGTEIVCQEEPTEAYLPFNGWRRKVSFYADLHSLGSANYELRLFEGEKPVEEFKPNISYEIDVYNGLFNKLFDPRGINLLKGDLLNPLIIEDMADSWGTECSNYRNVIGGFREIGGPVTIVEGPVRSTSQSVFKYEASKIILNTTCYSNSPFIEFNLRIHWNEEHKRLKLSIPTLLENPELLCEIPGGAITRPSDGEEYYHNRWFMLKGKLNGKEAAIAIINNGQYGLDFKDGEVRLSVLRSAAYCHFKEFELSGTPHKKYMDQGVHEIRLLVAVGEPAELIKSLSGYADWLNAPPIVLSHLPIGRFSIKNHDVIFNEKNTDLFSLNPNNVRLLACKQSFDKSGLIIRIQETTGKNTIAEICLNKPKKNIKPKLNPFEIKTLKIEKNGLWKEVSIIWEE